MATLGRAYVEIVADTSKFSGNARRSVERALASANLGQSAERAGRTVGAGLSRGITRNSASIGKNIDRNITRNLDRLQNVAGRLLSPLATAGSELNRIARGSASFATLASAALSALPAVLSLGGSLVQLSGALAALPAFAVAGGIAVTALSLSLKGFSDAIKATTPDQLAKALEGMGPAARGLVTDLRNLLPAFNSVRQAAQESFVRALGPIQSITRLLPTLRAGFAQVGTALGQAAAQIRNFATAPRTLQLLAASFTTTAASIRAATTGLTPFLNGMRDLAQVALPFVQQFSQGLGNLAAQFGRFASQAAASGRAVEFIEQAVVVAGQLLSIFRSLGGIVLSFFQASSQAGGSFLTTLQGLTASLDQFFRSAQGRSDLNAFFTALAAIGSAIQPIFRSIIAVVGQLAPLVESLVTAIGPALAAAIGSLAPALAQLQPAIDAIGPALAQGLVALTPAFVPLAQAITEIVIAIAPLIPQLAQLAATAATTLAPQLAALAPSVVTLASALISLLQPLAESRVAMGLLLALVVGSQTGFFRFAVGAIRATQALRGFLALTQGLSTFARIAAVLPRVALLFSRLASVASTLFRVLRVGIVVVRLFGAALIANPIGLVVAAIALLVAALVLFFTKTEVGRKAIAAFGKALVAAFDAVRNFLGALPGIIAAGFEAVVTFFQQLPGRILAFFTALGTALANFFIALPGQLLALLTQGFQALLFGIGFLIGLIVLAIIKLPGLIIDGLASLGQLLFDFFSNAWDFAVRATTAGINAVVNFVVRLPGRVISAVTSLASTLANFFSNLWTNARRIFTNGVDAVVNFVRLFPARVISAVQSLSTTLSTFFSNLFKGIRTTVSTGIDGIVGFFKELPGQISGALAGLGSGLFQGLIDGLNFAIDSINSVIDGFNRVPGVPNIPNIPRLANGGIFNVPMRAIIAEAGPEAVIPLTRPRRAAQLARESNLLSVLRAGGLDLGDNDGGTTVTVNAPITVVTNSLDPLTVAYKVSARLSRLATI